MINVGDLYKARVTGDLLSVQDIHNGVGKFCSDKKFITLLCISNKKKYNGKVYEKQLEYFEHLIDDGSFKLIFSMER